MTDQNTKYLVIKLDEFDVQYLIDLLEMEEMAVEKGYSDNDGEEGEAGEVGKRLTSLRESLEEQVDWLSKGTVSP